MCSGIGADSTACLSSYVNMNMHPSRTSAGVRQPGIEHGELGDPAVIPWDYRLSMPMDEYVRSAPRGAFSEDPGRRGYAA